MPTTVPYEPLQSNIRFPLLGQSHFATTSLTIRRKAQKDRIRAWLVDTNVLLDSSEYVIKEQAVDMHVATFDEIEINLRHLCQIYRQPFVVD